MRTSESLTSSLAAAGSVIAASSCCLPIGTMWLAASAAGAGAFLEPLRPWLTGVSIALIAFGFWQARRASSCAPRLRKLNLALLAVAVFFVGASVLLPAYLNSGGHAVPSPQPELSELRSFEPFREVWNSAPPDQTTILVLLSPT